MKEGMPGHPRAEYEQTANDLENVRGDKKQVEDYYAEELKPHHDLRKEAGGPYVFDEELTQLEKARADELKPILESEAALAAKLKRLYSRAWSEAIRENYDREAAKTLEALGEMDAELGRIESELEDSEESDLRTAALACLNDMRDFVFSLKNLLTAGGPEAARKIQEHMLALAEAYGKLTELEHRILSRPS